MQLTYSYNNATPIPWRVFMRAESDDTVPEYHSILDFELRFTYFIPPDTLPKFSSPPQLVHEVTADFDLRYNL